MNPRDITPVLDSPLNRLFFAINHYVSTGDHFGEGVAQQEGDRVRVMILVNQSLPQDQADFECFRSRFDELAGVYDLALGYMGEHPPFEAWSFLIAEEQMESVARDLRARPGPAGWGSGKAIIDLHTWEE